MNVEAKIKSVYPSLTKSEKKVADYMLQEQDSIISKTLSNLSEIIGVGEATIVRFVNKCGYDALHAFRFDVVRNAEKQAITAGNIELANELSSVVIKQINNSMDGLDLDKVSEVAKLIEKADDILFFGIGHSGIVAEMGAYRSMRLGKNAKAVTDSHHMAIQATLCNEDDLIFAVSLSGQSPETNTAVKIARDNKAKIVAIVSYMQSELAQLADYVFLATSEKVFARFDGSGIDAIITQLLMIETIFNEYSHIDYEYTKMMGEKLTMSFSRERRK